MQTGACLQFTGVCQARCWRETLSPGGKHCSSSSTSTGSPRRILMGEKITGTNDFAYFSRKIIRTRGGRKKWKKKKTAGAGTKISSPRPTYPPFRHDYVVLRLAKNHPWILTTLECPKTPDPPRNSCRQIPELKPHSVEGSLG